MTYRLKINGTDVANPAQGGIKVTDEPIWADGAGRDVSTGKMIATLVCWKRQVEITWGSLTWSQARTILNAIKSGGSFFSIQYNDIDTNSYVTLKVYVSSIPHTITTLANSDNTDVKRIKDVTIRFTEQ